MLLQVFIISNLAARFIATKNTETDPVRTRSSLYKNVFTSSDDEHYFLYWDLQLHLAAIEFAMRLR